jgi:hypothetical protein
MNLDRSTYPSPSRRATCHDEAAVLHKAILRQASLRTTRLP